MTNASLFLGLMAETAVYAGASAANHVIDLPIMREHNTGWPVVFGSAVKGALRAKANNISMERQLLVTLFGPDTNNASDHAGSLLISDARLLWLPVRSLTTQFRYVTCPDLLVRWQRDRQRAGLSVEPLELPNIATNEAIVVEMTKNLFLEEYVYTPISTGIELTRLVNELAVLAGRDVDDVSAKLTIINNDQFALLCRAAIPVNAHIAIENTTKTVKPGALWYAESLPAESLLYTLIGAHASRNTTVKKTADELLQAIRMELFATPYLQLGGNETTGMGWCKVEIQDAEP